MNTEYNQRLKNNSQKLRRNMTKEEKHLWYDFLKTLPVTVKRQKIIGNYIVDFYIASKKIIIELDGAQHFEEENQQCDTIRDKYLSNLGLTVLRYSNYDINTNFDGVCEDIKKRIK
ncbi:MAG: endonuclease domain-containing protein [Eubacterium sp.]|nr:endonuclease domain-containing protein [Eubacterium sp.]